MKSPRKIHKPIKIPLYRFLYIPYIDFRTKYQPGNIRSYFLDLYTIICNIVNFRICL